MRVVAGFVLLLVALDGGAVSPTHTWHSDSSRFADAAASDRHDSEAIIHDTPQSVAAVARLAWPLQPIAGFDQFNYNGVSNFVDHDARFPGFVEDYTCGTRTYDLASGYNHAGTDYFLWPYPWLMMDSQDIRVIAAAPGTIAFKNDGHFDRDCTLTGQTPPNEVDIQQDDGLRAIYLHFRSGSVTTQPLGARVETGDYLGLVGSSGNSTAPHMHFELRDASNAVVDPRSGMCNAVPDRWLVTQPYEDPKIVSLTTHSAEPAFVDCGVDANGNPVRETPNFKSTFAPGDDLWVFAAWRDQRNGELTSFAIARPDGSVFSSWTYDLASAGYPKPFYAGTGSDWQFTIPADAPQGIWQLTAQFQNATYTTPFNVAATASAPAINLGGYLSGNWYNVDESGTGFQLEFTSSGAVVAIWFTFEPSGGQPIWIYAQGAFDRSSNTMTLPASILTGAKFPPSYSVD
ncbi:MAG TPA: peptidoglycan DD-metalloendopeptidase family protein, partial [Rudaea sp.]|nr:peptidoglycan DD-metalloendopeptidase family protein [Rudaea sp.]